MNNKKKYTFKKGSYVYIEGDEDVDEVYIVEEGLIELQRSTSNIESYRNIARAGDIIGFISSLGNHPRVESAYAKEDSSVLVLGRNDFLLLLQKNSEIAVKVINYFADELRVYDEIICSNEDCFPAGSPAGGLFNLGQYYFQENSYENAYYIFLKYLQLYPDDDDNGKAREIIRQVEGTGIRTISEPIKNGINLEYVDNQIIFCEGEQGEELYIIKEGRVKIVKNNNNTEMMLSVLNEGEIFGELAIVSEKPRNATAFSYGKTVLIPINKNSFLTLISRSPEILKRIFTAISQRVWFTTVRIESRLYQKPLTRIYALMEDMLLEQNISLRSRKSHTFNFGIDELLKMIDLSQNDIGDSMDDLLKDSNLSFNFGQITIEDSSKLSDQARFHRSRDVLSKSSEETPLNGETHIENKKTIESSEPGKDSVLSELDDIDFIE
ncbi:cyclic nucleotide-binding domain-containing protein [Spirochaetota bacterium]